MPNISVPLALAEPVSATGGNWMITPLLSAANFVTCCASGTVVPVQFASFVQEKYIAFCAVLTHEEPQS